EREREQQKRAQRDRERRKSKKNIVSEPDESENESSHESVRSNKSSIAGSKNDVDVIIRFNVKKEQAMNMPPEDELQINMPDFIQKELKGQLKKQIDSSVSLSTSVASQSSSTSLQSQSQSSSSSLSSQPQLLYKNEQINNSKDQAHKYQSRNLSPNKLPQNRKIVNKYSDDEDDDETSSASSSSQSLSQSASQLSSEEFSDIPREKQHIYQSPKKKPNKLSYNKKRNEQYDDDLTSEDSEHLQSPQHRNYRDKGFLQRRIGNENSPKKSPLRKQDDSSDEMKIPTGLLSPPLSDQLRLSSRRELEDLREKEHKYQQNKSSTVKLEKRTQRNIQDNDDLIDSDFLKPSQLQFTNKHYSLESINADINSSEQSELQAYAKKTNIRQSDRSQRNVSQNKPNQRKPQYYGSDESGTDSSSESSSYTSQRTTTEQFYAMPSQSSLSTSQSKSSQSSTTSMGDIDIVLRKGVKYKDDYQPQQQVPTPNKSAKKEMLSTYADEEFMPNQLDPNRQSPELLVDKLVNMLRPKSPTQQKSRSPTVNFNSHHSDHDVTSPTKQRSKQSTKKSNPYYQNTDMDSDQQFLGRNSPELIVDKLVKILRPRSPTQQRSKSPTKKIRK
ncbi:MAG: hypothetical protein EZS28_035462, partial [Streblomastix strix]